MGLFKSKYEIQLDNIIQSLEMNLANNYKDSTQSDLLELEKTLQEFKDKELLKPKKAAIYETKVSEYKSRLKGYTHKDQKPYWT